MSLSHAKHNKKVCDFLDLSEGIECNDWVVTTSFYSVIHFLDHAIFPCNNYTADRCFNSISEAHAFIGAKSLHKTRGVLINKVLPDFASDYDFLLSTCHSARYRDYNVHEVLSKKSVRVLKRFEKTFNKEKVEIKLK